VGDFSIDIGLLVPTLRVGTRFFRRSASAVATQSVADGAFPRRTVGTSMSRPCRWRPKREPAIAYKLAAVIAGDAARVLGATG